MFIDDDVRVGPSRHALVTIDHSAQRTGLRHLLEPCLRRHPRKLPSSPRALNGLFTKQGVVAIPFS